ncbi:serine/threonine-protein kinase [Streptomyces sp. MAA16]|uniref:serine/threonine-protein kinase n=1 Tax=Streptomyces sp. MAA16 TaxID=3035116 RepID=UPI002474EA3E|nr:serine/threonine-protein kinase [Streptomyces sp. MAA16]
MNEGDTGRRVVDERFALEARLGGGGMGTVWRARDLLLHRSVAVKEVRPADPGLAEYDPASARALRERVLREARALARVQHPNVVTIHHIVDGGEGTYPWIVMELVEGGSLADRLARGPMAPAEAALVGRGVLDALRAAHATGVQHRDVKPANVLLRPDGRPVLTDFGIAAIREATALTATGSIIGTPDYMAPERVTGEAGGPAADLWSLAMMLYEAVEGRHPLRRATTLATLAAVIREEVPPPARAGALAPVLRSLLVRDPAARPDAATVDRMLAEVTDPAAAPPPPASGPQSPAPADAIPATDPHQPQTSYPLAPPAQPPGPGPVPLVTVVPPTGAGRPGRVRRALIATGAVGVVAIGGIVWQALPGDDGKDASASTGTDGRTSQPRPSTSATPSAGSDKGGASASPRATASPAAGKGRTYGLLGPDGIRTALDAVREETGRTRFTDLTVYPEFVSVQAMVPGSKNRYDTYTYRPESGVTKGIISGSLSSGKKPSSLEEYDWDAVPALLAKAEKDLKVSKPTTRYLVLREAGNVFGTPAGMMIYLTNEYQEVGYLFADTKGKIIDERPFQD